MLLLYWRPVFFQEPFLIEEICFCLRKCSGNIHSAWTCGRRLILSIRTIFWEVTWLLATFLEMTFNATTIACDILCPAFFHVFLAEGFTTSEALSLGLCRTCRRTGILFVRRILGFLASTIVCLVVYGCWRLLFIALDLLHCRISWFFSL